MGLDAIEPTLTKCVVGRKSIEQKGGITFARVDNKYLATLLSDDLGTNKKTTRILQTLSIAAGRGRTCLCVDCFRFFRHFFGPQSQRIDASLQQQPRSDVVVLVPDAVQHLRRRLHPRRDPSLVVIVSGGAVVVSVVHLEGDRKERILGRRQRRHFSGRYGCRQSGQRRRGRGEGRRRYPDRATRGTGGSKVARVGGLKRYDSIFVTIESKRLTDGTPFRAYVPEGATETRASAATATRAVPRGR